jgi:hypothetical protein
MLPSNRRGPKTPSSGGIRGEDSLLVNDLLVIAAANIAAGVNLWVDSHARTR